LSDTAWFLVAFLLLAVAMALGVWRWRRSLRTLHPVSGFVLLAATLGGLLGAPFWWFDLPAAFAWDLPALASRMLAAAGLAFGLSGIVVLEKPSRPKARFYLVLVAVYLVPLALAIVVFHLDRFDFSKPITYGFFSIVLVLSIGAALGLCYEKDADDAAPPAESAWFLCIGGVLAVWGLALFLVPATTAVPFLFNWPRDPLTSRLIASMLLTLAVAFLSARRNAQLVPPALVFAATYGAGVLAACLMNLLAGRPLPILYTTAFGLLGVVSALLLVRHMQRLAKT